MTAPQPHTPVPDTLAKTRAAFESARFFRGRGRLDQSLEGEARITALSGFLADDFGHDSVPYAATNPDMAEITFEAERINAGRPFMQATATRLVDALLQHAAPHAAARFLKIFEGHALLTALNPVLSPTQAEALARRIIDGDDTHRFKAHRAFFAALCPDAMPALNAAFTKRRKATIETLTQNAIDAFAEGHAAQDNAALSRLKFDYAVPQAALASIGATIVAAYLAQGRYLDVSRFMDSAPFAKVFGHPATVLNEDQAHALAAHYLEKGDRHSYAAVLKRFEGHMPGLTPRLAPQYDATRRRLINQNIANAAAHFKKSQFHWQAGWRLLADCRENLSATPAEMDAAQKRILKHFVDKKQFSDAVLFLKNPHHAKLFEKSALTPKQADAIATGLENPLMRAAFTGAPMPDAALLAAFAPVLDASEQGVHTLLQSVMASDHTAVADAQNRALAPMWDAYEQSLAPALNPGDLSTMFGRIARFMNIVQTQSPIIAPMGLRDTGAVPGVAQKLSHGTRAGFFGAANFARVALTYDDTRPVHSKFDFIIVARGDAQRDEGMVMEGERLYCMPLIQIDDDILAATNAHGCTNMLRHFQAIEAVKNHDYLHYLMARNLNSYFMNDGVYLAEEKQPYTLIQTGDYTGRNHVNTARPYPGELGRDAFTSAYDRTNGTLRYMDNMAHRQVHEFHVLHTNAALYRDELHKGPVGRAMETHIDAFFEGAQKLGAALTAKGDTRTADTAKMYYAGLIYNTLLYIVPRTHPLLVRVEGHIDALGISRPRLEETLTRRHALRKPDTLATINADAGVDGGAPANLSDAQIARWHAHAIGAGFLRGLHTNPRAAATALPEFARVMVAVRADLQAAEDKGGLKTHRARVLETLKAR